MESVVLWSQVLLMLTCLVVYKSIKESYGRSCSETSCC